MAVWTFNPPRGCYIAELGPYLGPLPSAPPIPANVPIDADTIQYWIGVRDPAADLTVDSGFVGGVVLALSRGWNGTPGDTSDMFTDHFDGGIDPTAVLNISAVYTEGDGPPIVTPESVMPPQFAAAGTGSPVMDPRVGAWSSDLNVTTTGSDGVSSTGNTFSITAADGSSTSPSTSEQQFINNIVASTAMTSIGDATYPASFGLDTFKPGQSGPTWITTVMDLALGIFGGVSASGCTHMISELDAAASLAGSHDFQTLLMQLGAPYDTWIEGLDYWALPGTDYEYFEYVGTDEGAFVRWEPFDAVFVPSGENHNAGAETYDSINFELLAVSGSLPTAPVADGAGTSLASISATTDVTQSVITVTGVDIGTDRVVSLVFKPIVGALGPPFATFSTSSTQIGWGARWGVDAGIQATYDGAPFRLWIPGPSDAGVKWHTVGGHWATVGGATMRILTPLPGGSVWVDVVDGPA